MFKTKMAPDHRLKATTKTTTATEAARRTYVTFLAGDGDYVKGVVGLAKGLRKVKSRYPVLVVAVLPDVPEVHRRLLEEQQGCIVREIEPVHPPENGTRFAQPHYAINYSKLRIWQFVEYERAIYLDGDIQVYDNIDHLFDLPDGCFYAAPDCLCEYWEEQCREAVRWSPALGPRPRIYFNAGMFVFEPNLSTYHHLLTTLQLTPHTPFAEQDFLNMFFKDTYKPVSPIYNFILATLWRHPDAIDPDRVKVVHYCAEGSKPWRYTGKGKNMDREDVRMLINKWMDIYNDESLNCTTTMRSMTGKFVEALAEVSGVRHIAAAPSAA